MATAYEELRNRALETQTPEAVSTTAPKVTPSKQEVKVETGGQTPSFAQLRERAFATSASTPASAVAQVTPRSQAVSTPQSKKFSYLAEAGKVIGYGAQEFAQSLAALPMDLGMRDTPLMYIPNIVAKPETGVGQFASTAVQFLIPYTGALKMASLALKLAKVGKLSKVASTAKYTAAGAVADFVAFKPNDPGLANLIQSLHPDQRIPIVSEIESLLATDENDNAAINRLRHVAEGLGIGAAVPVILRGLGKGGSIAITAPAKAIGAMLPESWARAGEQGMNSVIQKFADWSNSVTRIYDHAATLKDAAGNPLVFDEKSLLNIKQEFRMTKATGEIFRRFAEEGTVSLRMGARGEEFVVTGEGLTQVVRDARKLGPTGEQDLEDVLKYLRSEQLEKTRMGSPISVTETARELARLRALPHFAELMRLVTRTQDVNSRMLDFAEEMGLLNKDNRMRLEFAEGNLSRNIWAPFYRHSEVKKLLEQEVRNPKRVSTDVLRKRRKSFKAMSDIEKDAYNLENPIGGIFANFTLGYQALIDKAIKNRAEANLFKLISDMGADGHTYAKKVPRKVVRHSISKDQVKSVVKATQKASLRQKQAAGQLSQAEVDAIKLQDELDIDELDALTEQMFPVYSNRTQIDKDVHVIYRNGVPEYWEVKDDLLMDTLRYMGPQFVPQGLKTWSKYLRPAKTFLTKLVTMNPAFFAGTNLTRDTLSFFVLSRSGYKPFVDMFKGLVHTMKGAATGAEKGVYKEAMTQGMGFGPGRTYGDARDASEYIGKMRSHGFDPTHKNVFVGDTVAKVSKLMDHLDERLQRFEMASRTQEYKRLVDQGYAPRKAAFLAREGGTDFANRGSSVYFRALTDTVPFLNASIQGTMRTMKALGMKRLLGKEFTAGEAEDVQRVWLKLWNLSITGGLVLPMLNYHGEEFYGDPKMATTYAAIPEYVKNTNYVVVLPRWFGEKENVVITVPKPFDFGIFPTLVEKMMQERYTPSERNVIYDYVKETLWQTYGRGGISNLPQLFRPGVELAINKKFTKSPIVPGEMGDGHMSQRKYYTRPTAIWVADKMQGIGPEWTQSPLQVEHIMNSFFGGLGQILLDQVDKMVEGKGWWQVDLGEKPAKRSDETFYINRFHKTTPLRFSEQESQMYDAAAKSRDFKKDFDSFAKMQDGLSRKEFQRLMSDKESKFWREQYPVFTKSLEQLGKINDTIEYFAKNRPQDLETRNFYLKQKQELVNQNMKVFFSQYYQMMDNK